MQELNSHGPAKGLGCKTGKNKSSVHKLLSCFFFFVVFFFAEMFLFSGQPPISVFIGFLILFKCDRSFWERIRYMTRLKIQLAKRDSTLLLSFFLFFFFFLHIQFEGAYDCGGIENNSRSAEAASSCRVQRVLVELSHSCPFPAPMLQPPPLLPSLPIGFSSSQHSQAAPVIAQMFPGRFLHPSFIKRCPLFLSLEVF